MIAGLILNNIPPRASALLDINILTKMAREKRVEAFRVVFEALKENDNKLILIDASRFELLGFSGNKKDYDFLENWIGKFTMLETRKEDVAMAKRLSSYYRCIDPNLNAKQISYADCLYAARIIRHTGNLFVATLDIHDYPVSIFDISETMVIEDQQKANIVAFITFNKSKWEEAERRFELSGQVAKS